MGSCSLANERVLGVLRLTEGILADNLEHVEARDVTRGAEGEQRGDRGASAGTATREAHTFAGMPAFSARGATL